MLQCSHWQNSVVWIEEQSIWTSPKHMLSVPPDGPNRQDVGREEIQEIFRRSQWAQVWSRTKYGGETKVRLLYPHLYCLDTCISERLLGCEGGTLSRKLDLSQVRQHGLVQLWFLLKAHKSDRHESIGGWAVITVVAAVFIDHDANVSTS